MDSHPVIPVLPATLAQLDLLLSQPAPDLEEVSQVILADMGATLQVFRCARKSRAVAGWRASRISDCVVHLGKARLLKQLQTMIPAVASLQEHPVKALLERARLTAEVSQFLAWQVSGISPEKAYLSGLLHEVGRMPAALGWCPDRFDLYDPFALGCAMIKEWGLPAFLEPSLLASPVELLSASPLARIVAAAWDIVNQRYHWRLAPIKVAAGPVQPIEPSAAAADFTSSTEARSGLSLVQ